MAAKVISRGEDHPALDTLRAKNAALEARNAELERQLAWFKRQVFGPKSERRVEDNPHQGQLAGFEAERGSAEPATEEVRYTRRKGTQRDDECVTAQGLRFDDSVPMRTIELSVPEEFADDFEVISHKETYRLAQRRASYVVLKYLRPVLKRKEDGAVSTMPAPDGLWRGAYADVSVIAGLIEDKLCYHLPLYRTHQRMGANGITLARSTLTHWIHRAAALLEPIYRAQLRHILLSKTLAVDETPIRAGRSTKGKDRRRMKTGYYWPVYGEDDEVAFAFSPSKAKVVLDKLLGDFSGTLLSDGAAAYARFAAERPALTHAQCWAHTRRGFVEAEASDPQAVGEALELIGALYLVETHIRDHALDAEATQAYRTEHARARVDAFFEWIRAQVQRTELTPAHPLSEALAYAQAREAQLRVYLTDATVTIDTNHLERTLRVIPMGKKNWMFCWTEVGAEVVGILQSLLSTCRLHGVHPYTYLVDVLQRVAIHPDSQVEDLTPRRWKTLFADNPLRSDLDLADATS